MQKKNYSLLILGLLSFQQTVLGMHGVEDEQILKSVETDSLQQYVAMDEFVVHSFKQNRDLSLSPVAASTLTSSMIQNKNITDMKSVSSLVPNFFMPDYGSRLTSPVYMRGIGSKINAPSVGLYVDDMPYFEKSAFDFNFNDIERIEVLRGPQGTLYGRNTMGGLIKVYTRSPFRYSGTNLSVGAGSYKSMKVGASHYGKVNQKLGYAFSGNYDQSGGYFINKYTGQYADDYKNASVRGRLEWRPSDAWKIGLTSTYDFSNEGGYPYALYDAETGKVGQVNYNNRGSYKRVMSTTGLSAQYQAERFQVNSQTSYQYIDDLQGIDQDFSVQSLYYAQQKQKQHMVSEELNIKSVDGAMKHYNWLFGAFAFWQGIDNTVTLDYLSQNMTSEKYYDQPTYGVAFYHQSEIRNIGVRGLSLIAGLRYDLEWAKMDYSGVMMQANADKSTPLVPFVSHLDFGQLTPKVALQYEFPSSGILYASASRGYKTGGFNTSFESEDQRSFRPEYSWNYEVGAKHPFFDKRLSAEIALFWIDWRNQQISQPLPSGKGSMLTNAGRSESKGVELSMNYNVINGLILNANYGYTHARFLDYKNGANDYENHRLPFVPEHTFTIGANYSIGYPFRGVDRITLGADYTGNGKIYWREDNKVSQPFYGLLNAKVSASRDFLTMSLWARNITATDYIAFYFESGAQKLAQKGKPFTIGADLQFRF